MLERSKMLVKNRLTLSIIIFLTSSSSSTLTNAYVFKEHPIHKQLAITTGAGRFGEGRGGKGPTFGVRPHQGVDISANKNIPLYAVADAEVIQSVNTGNGGGIGTAIQPFDNKNVVAVYWHQTSIHKSAFGRGQKVTAGSTIGYVGNTKVASLNQPSGNNGMADHLHFGVGVSKSVDAVSAWINNRPRSGSEIIHKNIMAQMKEGKTPFLGGKQYFWTNPAPYLPKDSLIRVTGGSDPLIPFLGNSIRSQYNALTGAKLTLANGAREGVKAHLVPKLKVNSNGVPNDVASEMGQAAVVGVLAGGEADDLLGQSSLTVEELAYYAPPRSIFGGDSEVSIDIGDGDITKAELIQKIGTARFGNSEWQAQLLGLSMRGMLIEYLNSLNANNFLKKEMLLQQERIESLYAAWTATITKLNVEGDLKEVLEKAQSPDIIPEVSRIPVEVLLERIEAGYPVSGSDFSKAVTIASLEGYKGCNPQYLAHWANLPMAQKRELLALSLRLGFHPIDFLTAIAVESGFNSQKNLYRDKYYYKDKKGVTKRRVPAGGFIQLTPGGAGDIPYAKMLSLYPESTTVLKQYLGSTPASMGKVAQTIAHGPYLKKLQDIDPKLEFAVYDAYFYAKNRAFTTTPASEKNLIKMYTMTLGGPYRKGTAGYKGNEQYDLDNNGVYDASEAVLHPMFTARRCPYVSDSDILTNKYGLTNENLKYILWSDKISRVKSPTLDNLGGHFAFSQAYQARKNAK